MSNPDSLESAAEPSPGTLGEGWLRILSSWSVFTTSKGRPSPQSSPRVPGEEFRGGRRVRLIPALAAVAFTLSLLQSTIIRAADEWTLTTADFKSAIVELQSMNEREVVITTTAEPVSKPIALDRVLSVRRSQLKAPNGNIFMVHLASRDRAAGEPVAIEGETLIWNSPLVGRVPLPLRSVVSISRADLPEPAIAAGGPAQLEDLITLRNGDTIRGIISTIDSTNVSVQQAGGEKATAPFSSISRISFAATGAPTKKPGRGFQVVLSDGSALTSPQVKIAGRQLSFSTADGATKAIDTNQCVAIEQVNGPVVWLSSLAPTESIQTPLFDVAWPARIDRAVDGGPIRFGERTFSHGVGVHSYSRLTYAIDPAWQTFRTQYAIAGDWSYANVTVRIKLDGKDVHENKDFRGGVLQQPVIVPLSGQKTLTLEVDYGLNYDVQDRFNWIEPAFLTFRPEPTTAPSK